MRLLFRVLWVDDQPDQVEPYVYAIEPAITEEGFKFEVVKVRSLEEAMGYVSAEGVILDNIDLVLIDYHLDTGADGDVVAREIRKLVPYKDIVFYSSDTLVELQKKIFDQNVEGVYCAHRTDLVAKVRGLFRDIVRKVVDLEHIRGIVMGATSDNEQLVTEAIVAVDPNIIEEHRAELVALADKILDRTANDIARVRRKLGEGGSLAELMNSFQFGASHRIDLILGILSLHYAGGDPELCKALSNYQKGAMRMRNKLGHARVRVQGSTSVLRSGEKVYTVEELKELRRELVAFVDHCARLSAISGISD